MGGELTDILVYWIIFNALESERVTGSSGVGCWQKFYGFINVKNTNAIIIYFSTTDDDNPHSIEKYFKNQENNYFLFIVCK